MTSTPLHLLAVDRARAGEALERTWAQGAAAAVLPEGAPDREVHRQLALLRPAALVTVDADGRASTHHLADPVAVDPGVALVVVTSGSTGEPKGVELTHDALAVSVAASLTRLGAQPGDRWGLALPTHHIAGISVHLRAAALGGRPAVAESTDGIGALEVELLSVVPTQLARMLELGVDLGRYRAILLGGAAAPPALLTRAAAAGGRIVRSYGMTETVGGCVYDGHPFEDVEVAVDERGRIRIRGPVLLHGYRHARAGGPPVSTDPREAHGWFTTADLGRFVDGRLEVLGRADDVLISGGENVPLAAVARLLAGHPAVAEAAVTAVADPRWGEVPVAVVVPSDPGAPPGLEELVAHVRSDAPAAYAPARLVLVPRLPRDAMGKLPRAALDAVVAAVDTPGTS